MHAGAEEVEAAFAAQGVVDGKKDEAVTDEGLDQKACEDETKIVE